MFVISTSYISICQVTYLLEKQFVEEAILLAETVAALEEIKNPEKADEVQYWTQKNLRVVIVEQLLYDSA